MVALLVLLVVWSGLGVLTFFGSRRRGNTVDHAIVEGLAWPGAWIGWFVIDNRAEGRSWFDGRPH